MGLAPGWKAKFRDSGCETAKPSVPSLQRAVDEHGRTRSVWTILRITG